MLRLAAGTDCAAPNAPGKRGCIHNSQRPNVRSQLHHQQDAYTQTYMHSFTLHTMKREEMLMGKELVSCGTCLSPLARIFLRISTRRLSNV